MLKNYFVITFRNLYKNRVFALINIVGLGVALSVCMVAYFNHMFDHEFDRWHENFNEIYRVNSFLDMDGRQQEYGSIPASLGLEIKNDIPGVSRSARLFRSYSPVKVGRENFNRQVSYVDPEFIDIFTFYLLYGTKAALENPDNVIISEDMASVLFGSENPLGKTVSIFNDNNKEYAYTVGGVFKDLPQNSSFRIDILTHIENFLTMWEVNDTDWRSFVRALFIQVPDPINISSIEKGLDRYIPVQNKANERTTITRFTLVPLKDVGDNSRDIWNSSLFPGLHPAAVMAPPIMALMILLIACFNFANTAIATAGKRLKEIGIRKVVGGVRSQLLVQFLLENFVICFLALLVGILGGSILVPAYSSMWEYMTLVFSFTDFWSFWIFLFFLLIFTGFIAGAYPALYISSFRPLVILQGKTKLGSGGPLAKILLGFQFGISVLAIISGIIFSKNAVYQETVDLGYARRELIVVPVNPVNFNSYLESVQQNPKILNIAGTQEHIGWGNYRRSIEDAQKQIEVNVMDVGPNYLHVMGLKIQDGRIFDRERVDADRRGSIVINRKMVDAFGWDEAVGKQVSMNDTLILTVIGVVEDFFTNGLWAKIEPTLLRLPTEDRYFSMAIRAKESDLPEVLDYLRETWVDMFPNYPFTGRYQEDTLQEEKDINRSIKQLYVFLAIVATLLSMIGLYTLVSLSILNRTKEIGIRKVLGAPLTNIFYVLSRNFLIILAFTSILGCIGGYYLSIVLLDSIWDHFLDFTPGIFINSILIIFGATLLTMAGKIYKAALQNPVDSIRYE